MPKIPVDTAVRLMVGPLIDDTDFKSRELTVAFDVAGMDVDLLKSSDTGTPTTTAITLTSSGSNDWVELSGGFYYIELTAAQNDTEGKLRLIGIATGILVFQSVEFDVIPIATYNAEVSGSSAICTQPAGARQVTINVKDDLGANVLGVEMSLFDAANTAFITQDTTDSNGDIAVNLDDATYKLRFVRQGHSFTSPETLVVTTDQTSNFIATRLVPTATSAPNLCQIFGTIRDAQGVAIQSAVVQLRPNSPDSEAGDQFTSTIVSTTTDATGLFEIEVVRNSKQLLTISEARIFDSPRTVPDAASQDVTTWAED